MATPFSKIFPMIRFATGDLSYLIQSPCPCGRTSIRLGKILGRPAQVTKVWGIFIHPWQVDEMMNYIELKEEVADKIGLKRKIESEVQEVLKVKGEVVFTVRGGIPDRAKKIDDRRIWE